jgi:hypothetical protein
MHGILHVAGRGTRIIRRCEIVAGAGAWWRRFGEYGGDVVFESARGDEEPVGDVGS